MGRGTDPPGKLEKIVKKLFPALLLLIGCSVTDTAKLAELEPPLVVVAKTQDQNYWSNNRMIVRDKNNMFLELTGRQWQKGYEVGDTLK